jgi:peroxiredoxin
MPQLDALRQEYSREDFEVVGINVDPLVDDGRRFLQKFPVSYPIASDAGGSAAEWFGVSVLPALFVIDRSGVVRAARLGEDAHAGSDLRATVARLIEDAEVQ